MADEGGAHRALVADAVQVHVGFGGAGDVVFLGVLLVVAVGQDLDLHADGDGVVGQFVVVDDAGDLQGSFQVGDAGFHDGLLFLGGIVFGIFRKVAVTAGHLDLVRHFFPFDGAQVVQVLLQFLISLAGNNNLFGHFG